MLSARGLLRGHPVAWDIEIETWRYEDGRPATEPRPCVACAALFPNGEPDPCVGMVPGLHSFCCGHGVEEPYAVIDRESIDIRHRFDTGSCRISSSAFLSLPCVLHKATTTANHTENTLSKQHADEAEHASLVDYLHVGRHLGMANPDVQNAMARKRIDAATQRLGFVNVWRVARMLEQDGAA